MKMTRAARRAGLPDRSFVKTSAVHAIRGVMPTRMVRPTTIGRPVVALPVFSRGVSGLNDPVEKERDMLDALRGGLGERDVSRWLPWVLGAVVLLYIIGYVDGTVHGAVLGSTGANLGYVHEFFHHARHVAMMCH